MDADAGVYAAWVRLLDALEEHTRRAATTADGTPLDAAGPALVAPGPLPDDLRHRALTLLATTDRVTDRLRAARARRERELRYLAS